VERGKGRLSGGENDLKTGEAGKGWKELMSGNRAQGSAMTLNKKLTKSEFRQRADKILMRLSLEVMPFWADSEEKQKQRQERAASDPLYFCRTYLPHYFAHGPAPFHQELVRLLEQRHEEVVTPIAVAAPREFAKTTVCSSYSPLP
jgi:hypothetical protein